MRQGTPKNVLCYLFFDNIPGTNWRIFSTQCAYDIALGATTIQNLRTPQTSISVSSQSGRISVLSPEKTCWVSACVNLSSLIASGRAGARQFNSSDGEITFGILVHWKVAEQIQDQGVDKQSTETNAFYDTARFDVLSRTVPCRYIHHNFNSAEYLFSAYIYISS